MKNDEKWLLRGILIFVGVVSAVLFILAFTQPDWLKNIPVPSWFH